VGDFKWLKRIEGANPADSAFSHSIAIDLSGNTYVAGTFKGTVDTNPTGTSDTLTSAGEEDVFFAKYDTAGVYKWGKRIGGDTTDVGSGIAAYNSENIFLTGFFGKTTVFDPLTGTASRTSAGDNDLFIAKYDQGTSLITGQIRLANGDTVKMGEVKLYTQSPNDGNAALHLVDVNQIDLYGNYAFSEVCAGNYIVLANGIIDAFSLAATYYGDSTHWQYATPVLITAPNTIYQADIKMKVYASLTGIAELSGIVIEGSGFDRIAGDPIPGVPIGLEGDPGSIIAHTSTGLDGKYTFNSLPAGCYKIYVNIPGLPMDSTYHFCLDSLEIKTGLDFIADSSSININPAPTSSEQMTQSTTKIKLYPNPHNGETIIEFRILDSKNVRLELYNLLGEKVAELLNEYKHEGIVRYRFNALDKGLKAGIYLLKVEAGDEVSTIKMIQIE
jgi:hypothetical protein